MKTYHIKNKEIITNGPHLSRGAITVVATILLLITPAAFAHKLNMFAYVEGDKIFAEGYFTDGKKAKNSGVTVYDPTNNELLTGTTDGDGQFSFAIPQQSDLRITVNAGMGHQAEYVLLKSELSEEADAATPVVEPAATIAADSASQQNPDGPLTPVTTVKLDEAAVRVEVERAVGKAIKPLMRELSEMRAEKSFSDIVGGVGFIFGLLGVFMYFKARQP